MNNLILINALEDCFVKCHKMCDHFKVYQVEKALQKAQRMIHEPMQLAVIGRISSSKSTLVNAMLGQPNAMRTDKSEETYNVCWLKYGTDTENINVVFKDDTKITIPRSELAVWSSRRTSNQKKDEVAYIEIFYPYEILKEINIIDTPGLDSSYGKDSENTLNFIKIHKPDAVLMVFSKSLNQETLDTLSAFQKNCREYDYEFSPINAIGVLGKIDEYWNIAQQSKGALDRANDVIKSLFASNPFLKEYFVRILPVSALLGLSSASITDQDVLLLRKLTQVSEEEKFFIFSGIDMFRTYPLSNPIKESERVCLIEKFGLYGTFVLLRYINQNPNCNLEYLKQLINQVSGMEALIKTVLMHFGERSTLIKVKSVVSELYHLCQQELEKNSDDPTVINIIEGINDNINNVLSAVREYDQWDFINKVYSKEINVGAYYQEILRALGEEGQSACRRLGVDNVSNSNELESIASEKYKKWQIQYNLARRSNKHHEIKLSKIMMLAYQDLCKEISKAAKEIDKREKEIKTLKEFLYG